VNPDGSLRQRRIGANLTTVIADGLERFVFRYHPLLGTVIDVVVIERSEQRARAISEAAVSELERLEHVFSMYRAESELSRWKRDELDDPSGEFCAVMAIALDWHTRSGGTFNPLAGRLSRVWADAELAGTVPTEDHLAAIAESIVEPRYTITDGVPIRNGDCRDLNLNAIAKGYIVDTAVTSVRDAGSPGVLVSAGGDMRHVGTDPVSVGIENPLRPYDNEPPLTTVSLHDAGLATSGGARRGWTIAGRRFSHALDARTGMPIEAQASITVIAPDSMTADVVATAAGALTPEEAVRMIESMPDVACLVIDSNGAAHHDRRWHRLVDGRHRHDP
jgi:FAD:protein FMN transferase